MNEEQNKILNMDSDQLKDLILKLREDILNRIKRLSRQWEMIHEIQKRRDRAENRLAELGGNIGSIYSKSRDWKKEEED